MSNPILLIQIHARHDTQGPITMATEAQANANRKNSKKSTGPRTPEGKTISSRNSLVHGMTSGKFLPPDGDPDEFFQLLDQFRDRFQPFDQAEDALVERLVAAEFKMRSVRYLDAGLFHYQAESSPMPEQFNKEGSTNPMAWAFNYDAAQHNSFSKLIRYEGFLQREFSRALRDLYMMQDERRARQADAACAQVEAAEAAPSEPEAPPTAPKTEKTKRTQFPEGAGATDGGAHPDRPLNPNRNPSSGGS
jgi:hypothetical protein